jgi:hypothetical protein
MVKKSPTLFERYRRLRRIARFLHRRGTLFHSKVPERKILFEQPHSSRKKSWRPLRKIRYLIKRGSLFRSSKKTAITSDFPPSVSQDRKKTSGFHTYLTYRRLRFLINTGKLFTRRKPEHPVKKRKRKAFRKIRFLLKRGTLIKFQQEKIKLFWKNYFRIILKPDYLKIIINSTILFLLAYFIVFTIVNFTSSFFALSYDIKSSVYYYSIDYLISSKDWKIDAIRVVFTAGPFFSFIFSLFVLAVYINVSHETWFIRLFLFWIFCHAFNHFFGAMLVGTLLMKGIGLSIAYIISSEYKKLLIIIISLSFLILTGILLTKIALFSGNSYFNMITKKNRSYFIQSQFLIPYIIGFTILVLIKTPKITEYDVLLNLTMLLLILPMVFRGLSMKDMYFDPEPRIIVIRLKMLLLLGVVLVLFRVIFENGFRIG